MVEGGHARLHKVIERLTLGIGYARLQAELCELRAVCRPAIGTGKKSLAPSSNPYIPYEDASMAHVDPADAAAVRIGSATRRNTICVSAGRCMRIMRARPLNVILVILI